MKKILAYIILSLIISNTSFAKKSGCTDGDCNNDLEPGLIQIRQLMLGNGKTVQKKEKVLRLGLTGMSMKVNLMIVNGMVKEL